MYRATVIGPDGQAVISGWLVDGVSQLIDSELDLFVDDNERTVLFVNRDAVLAVLLMREE